MSRSRNRDRNNVKDYGILNHESRVEANSGDTQSTTSTDNYSNIKTLSITNNNNNTISTIIRTISKPINNEAPQFDKENKNTDDIKPNSLNQRILSNDTNRTSNAINNISKNSTTPDNKEKLDLEDNKADDSNKYKNEKQEIAYKAYCYLNGKNKMHKKNFSGKEIAKILKEYSLSRFGKIIPQEVLTETIKAT